MPMTEAATYFCEHHQPVQHSTITAVWSQSYAFQLRHGSMEVGNHIEAWKHEITRNHMESH